MGRPIDFKLGPFTGGMLLALAAHLVPASHAVIAYDLDNSQGTLRGLFGYGNAVDTIVGPSVGSVVWAPGVGWTEHNYNEWFCYDTPFGAGTDDPVTYLTQQGNPAVAYVDGLLYDLGLDAPTSQPTGVTSGASGGVRAYAFTFKNSITGWESNPLDVTTTVTNCTGAILDFTPYSVSDPYADTIVIYGTTPGRTTGTKYYLTEIALNTNFTDNAGTYPGDASAPLNWRLGGNPDDTDFPYDHSPAPSLNVLSDSMHAFAEGLDSFGQGILFGSVGKWLAWSQAGYPGYWPTANWQKFDANIEAIVSDVGVTFVFTSTDIYAISGTDDTSLTPRKTGAAFSVRAGQGHTVRRTPYGILFLGPLGLAVFDGETTRYVNEKMATYGNFDEDNTFEAVYHDQYYWLLNKEQGVVSYFDLTAWPNVEFFQSLAYAGTITNLINAPNHATPGLYIVESTNIRPWMPRREAEIDGAYRQNFSYRSPKLSAPEGMGAVMTRDKRFCRFWLNHAGAVEVTFYVDGLLVHTASASGWLPRSAIGKSIQVGIVSVNDASTEAVELVIEAEVLNG